MSRVWAGLLAVGVLIASLFPASVARAYDWSPSTVGEITQTGTVEAKTSRLLQDTIERALFGLAWSDPTAIPSVSVRFGGATGEHRSEIPTDSASLAKLYWVVAAVDAVGIDPVEPYADPIFIWSDNPAAGQVIDLISADTINFATARLGMTATYLRSWSFGGSWVATAFDHPSRPFRNETSTHDATAFLHALLGGQILNDDETQAVLTWMRQTPDSINDSGGGWGGVLTDQLEPFVAATTAHKAGWLPPGTANDETSLLIVAGIVPVQGTTEPLIVSISVEDASDFGAAAEWIAALTSSLRTVISP